MFSFFPIFSSHSVFFDFLNHALVYNFLIQEFIHITSSTEGDTLSEHFWDVFKLS